jgi:signal peptidase I
MKTIAKKKSSGGVFETVKTIVYAILIALVVRTVAYEPFNIPSGSMIPTLLVGDYLFVSKFSYGYSRFSLPFGLPLFSGRIFEFHHPERGDVVVFKLPTDTSTDYIKRIVGLPGDKIQMIHGRLYINGAMVERAALPPYSTPGHFGRPVDVAHYEETLPGGVKHEIIELDGDDGYYDNTAVYEVPPGNYFMMGDNRDNSTDSRVPPDQGGVGFVPFDNLIGRAEVIFFSVEDGEPAWQVWRWPWIVRWHRLFQAVR